MRNFGIPITDHTRQAQAAASGASTSSSLAKSWPPSRGSQPTPSWMGEHPRSTVHEDFSFDPAALVLDQDLTPFDDREFAALAFAFACFVSPVLIGGALLFGLFVFL